MNFNGFGDVDNKVSFPMEFFKDDLYIGVWNDAGVEIWMTPEGTSTNWNQVNVNGFGAPENSHSTSMEVFNDKLYVNVHSERSQYCACVISCLLAQKRIAASVERDEA